MGAKIEKYQKSEIAILKNVQFYALWRFSIAPYFNTEHSSSLQTFAVFWPKMAKHDVTKTFSLKKMNGFFWNFGGRRQIDASEGSESFVSISETDFDLSKKSGRGAEFPPPSGARVKYVDS